MHKTESTTPDGAEDIRRVLQDELIERVLVLMRRTKSAGLALQIPASGNYIMAGQPDYLARTLADLVEPHAAGRPTGDQSEVLARQVAQWMKERDRLQDLIDTATGSASAAAQTSGDLTDEQIEEIAKKHSTTLRGWEWSGDIIEVNGSAEYEFAREVARAAIAAHLASQSQAAQPSDLEAFEAVCPEVYTDAERELLWKGWQLAGQSQATRAQAVPEGFALVPIEPTQEMFAAARTSTPGSNTEKLLMANYWRNMLAAAPTAQEVTQQAAPDLHMIQLRLKQILNPALGQLSAQWMAADALYYLTKDDSFADIADSLMTQQAAKAETAEQAKPELTVWESAMPESNGKSNFTAVLHRKDSKGFDLFTDGFQFARSEYPDRVRYEADFMRWLIGERAERPELWDDCYDMDKHSGYVAPTTSTVSAPDEIRNQAYAKCIEIAESELSNTNALMSNPPQSSAAFSIINRIRFLRTVSASGSADEKGGAA
jgi:hypothetical protein